MNELTKFSKSVIDIILQIPFGKVASYGMIAAFAGNPRAARQVARILHSCSSKYNLPWHRIVNSKGQISLKYGSGYEIQESLLKKESVLLLNGRLANKDDFWLGPNIITNHRL